MARMGRPTLFEKNGKGYRKQGYISHQGDVCFEAWRDRIADLMQRDRKLISDADVIEFLARGEQESRRYLKV